MSNTRKNFTVNEGGKEIELAVRQPQFDDFEQSDSVYASQIANLVRDSGKRKLLLRREVELYLKNNNLWTTEDEKNVKKLQKDIDTVLNDLRKGGIKLTQARKLCLDITDKRNEMVKVLSKRRLFDDTTVESLAEAARVDYLIYACTCYGQEGKSYWQSFEDMKNDKLSEVYRKASVMVYEVVYGVNTEFEKNLPENKLLVKFGFVDKDLNFIDRKTKEYVDRDGNPIKQLQEEALSDFNNLQGDITESTPFIDDETDKPFGEIVISHLENTVEKPAKVKKEKKEKKKKEVVESVVT